MNKKPAITLTLIILALLLGLAIWSGRQSPPTEPASRGAADTQTDTPRLDNSRQSVSRGDSDAGSDTDATPLSVLDVSERGFDDAPALAIVFASKLDPAIRYDEFIEVRRTGSAGGQSTAKDQPLGLVSGAWVLDDARRILYFPNTDPETQYTILVHRGLRAANGSELKANAEYQVSTRKITPAYDFASKGNILTARLTGGLPIMSVNVPEVDIEFMRVSDDRLPRFIDRFYKINTFYYYQLEHFSNDLESVYLARFKTEARANARTITHIPVEQIKELQRPGLYIAVMKRPAHFDYNQRTTFFFVSDIGLHTRLYPQALDVYVNSLTSGQALADVRLELYDAKGNLLNKVFSDALGYARLTQRPARTDMLFARHGEQMTLLSFNQPALDLSEFDIKGMGQQAMATYIYSDRDLYRPGEQAHVSVLLRDHDGRAVDPLPLSVTLKQPDGKVMLKEIWTTAELGYYQKNLRLPTGAQTGNWSLEVRSDPAQKEPTQSYTLKVEEFLPERIKLELSSEQARLGAGEEFSIAIQADYLYGAPAGGNRVTAALNMHRVDHPLEQLKEFFFGDVNESGKSQRRELIDAKLDEAGRFQLRFKPAEQSYQSPMAVRVNADVYETGGRPVSRSIQRIIWPHDALIGVRPLYEGENAEANSSVEFEVAMLATDGTRLDAQGLEVKVIREDRNYYWEYDDNRGWHYAYNETPYAIYQQNLDLKADTRASLRFPVEYGSYLLEIRDPHTGSINRFRFRAGWNWSDRYQADSARPDKVKLSLNQPSYRAGDTLKINIVPPHAGEAVLMIESDQMLWSKRLQLAAEGGDIELKIPAEWSSRHDVYFTATVFRPGNAQDKVTPNRALGVAHLRMDKADRRLQVDLSMPEKMQPEQPLRVQVEIKDLHEQSAMVTLAAVDVGILNITDFQSPDPNQLFFAKRRYAVGAYDVYDKIIENLAGVRAKLRFGGDAALDGETSKRAQAKVKTVALFHGPVKVDANGRATVTLDVPDYNGTLRVMAVAFSADRFGAGEKQIVVAAPVIAEISTPRFLSSGDNSRLSLDLHNLSGADQNLRVQLEASAPLRMEAVDQQLALNNQAKTTLRFALGGGDDFGVGEITLRVRGEQIDLTRRWELGVRPAYPGVRKILHQILKPGTTLSFDTSAADKLLPKTVDAGLAISANPPLNIRDAVRGLLTYPYGCLEQTSSRAFPHLYVDANQAVELGLKAQSLAERSEHVQNAIKRLRQLQLQAGGFGLWNNQSHEESWLTPYVVDFLLVAREQGFMVPDDMLQNGLKRLHQMLSGRSLTASRYTYSESHEHLRLASRAYAAYVLARLQRAPLGSLRNLFDKHRSEAKSGLPLIHLALALKLQGDEQRAAQGLREGVAKTRAADIYLGDYGSPLRDTAMIIHLLGKHALEINGGDELLYRLADELRAREYFSTQERLALFLAARDLHQHRGKAWAASLRGEETEISLAAEQGITHILSAAQLREGIVLQSNSDIPLYTRLEISGYPTEAPAPRMEDISIARDLFTLDGKPLADRSLKVGEMLIARLVVSADQRIEHGLLVDLLPAGLEIENLNISHGQSLDGILIDGVNPSKAMTSNDIKHQEYREDRFVAAINLHAHGGLSLYYLLRAVTPGEYRVPPPFVEDMYRPEIHGIGEAPKRMRVTQTD